MKREYRVWRLIAKFRDYLVSDDGCVMRLTKGTGSTRYGARIGRILKPAVDGCGYLRVLLYSANGRKLFTVHRLVAKTFIDNPAKRREVNHLDGNKTNNAVSNLEWATPSENRRHAFKIGLVRQKGSANNFAKLTENDVFTIRKLKTHGVSRKELAAMYCVSPDCIGQIVTRRRWRHV